MHMFSHLVQNEIVKSELEETMMNIESGWINTRSFGGNYQVHSRAIIVSYRLLAFGGHMLLTVYCKYVFHVEVARAFFFSSKILHISTPWLHFGPVCPK
jgi:hypothetical protein